MSVNEQNNCDMSHQTHFHTHQPKYQENVLAMQQFVKSKQFNPTQLVFAKNNQMRTVGLLKTIQSHFYLKTYSYDFGDLENCEL